MYKFVSHYNPFTEIFYDKLFLSVLTRDSSSNIRRYVRDPFTHAHIRALCQYEKNTTIHVTNANNRTFLPQKINYH